MSQTYPQQSDPLATFESLLDEMQLQFDSVVDSGTDQELFISGYLSGHFTLVASQCCLNGLTTLKQLNEQMLLSLQTAFSNGELESDDQQQVLVFWQRLATKFSD